MIKGLNRKSKMYYQIARTTREIIVIKTKNNLTNIPIYINYITKIETGVKERMTIKNIKDSPEDLNRKTMVEAALEGSSLKPLIININYLSWPDPRPTRSIQHSSIFWLASCQLPSCIQKNTS